MGRHFQKLQEADFVPVSLSDRDMMNPDSLSLKAVAKRNKDDADRAEAEQAKRERAAANKAKYGQIEEIIKSGLEADKRPSDILDNIFSLVVPREGKADTVAGEIVRAMMRVLYRMYNDGDKFYEGYGLETAAPSVAYLMDTIPAIDDRVRDIFEDLMIDTDHAYEKALEDMTRDCLDHILANIDTIFDSNEEDSREWSGSTLDEIEENQPRYEFEICASDDVYTLLENDIISSQDLYDYVENTIEWDNVFEGAEVLGPYRGDTCITVDNLTRDGYDMLEDWTRNLDRFWEELVNEYADDLEAIENGDYDEESEDDELDESLNESKSDFGVYYSENPDDEPIELKWFDKPGYYEVIDEDGVTLIDNEWIDTLEEFEELCDESYYSYDEDDEEPLVRFHYAVYEFSGDGNSDWYDTKEEAIEVAKTLGPKAHVVFIPTPDSDAGPAYREFIKYHAPYDDYEIVWKASEYTNDDELDESVKSQYDDKEDIEYAEKVVKDYFRDVEDGYGYVTVDKAVDDLSDKDILVDDESVIEYANKFNYPVMNFEDIQVILTPSAPSRKKISRELGVEYDRIDERLDENLKLKSSNETLNSYAERLHNDLLWSIDLDTPIYVMTTANDSVAVVVPKNVQSKIKAECDSFWKKYKLTPSKVDIKNNVGGQANLVGIIYSGFKATAEVEVRYTEPEQQLAYGESLNESSARPGHDRVLDALENDIVDADTLVHQLLKWMPDDQIVDFAEFYEYGNTLSEDTINFNLVPDKIAPDQLLGDVHLDASGQSVGIAGGTGGTVSNSGHTSGSTFGDKVKK